MLSKNKTKKFAPPARSSGMLDSLDAQAARLWPEWPVRCSEHEPDQCWPSPPPARLRPPRPTADHATGHRNGPSADDVCSRRAVSTTGRQRSVATRSRPPLGVATAAGIVAEAWAAAEAMVPSAAGPLPDASGGRGSPPSPGWAHALDGGERWRSSAQPPTRRPGTVPHEAPRRAPQRLLGEESCYERLHRGRPSAREERFSRAEAPPGRRQGSLLLRSSSASAVRQRRAPSPPPARQARQRQQDAGAELSRARHAAQRAEAARRELERELVEARREIARLRRCIRALQR